MSKLTDFTHSVAFIQNLDFKKLPNNTAFIIFDHFIHAGKQWKRKSTSCAHASCRSER